MRPRIDLRPYAAVDAGGALQWWIVSDLGETALGHAIPEGHVLGIGGASTTLSGLDDRAAGNTRARSRHRMRHPGPARRPTSPSGWSRPTSRSAHCGSPSLNAVLNAVPSIELRAGSLFEPVQGDRFDRIVSNPPFVITRGRPECPPTSIAMAGWSATNSSESVVRGLDEHLDHRRHRAAARQLGVPRRGGRACPRRIVVRGSRPLDRRARAHSGRAVRRDLDPRRRHPLRHAVRPDVQRVAGRLRAQRGVTEVGFGYLTLRRSGEPTLARTERLVGPVAPGLGEHSGAEPRCPRLAAARAAVRCQAHRRARRHRGAPLLAGRRASGRDHPAAGRWVPAGRCRAALPSPLWWAPATARSSSVRSVPQSPSCSRSMRRALTDEILPQIEELVFTGFPPTAERPAFCHTVTHVAADRPQGHRSRHRRSPGWLPLRLRFVGHQRRARCDPSPSSPSRMR